MEERRGRPRGTPGRAVPVGIALLAAALLLAAAAAAWVSQRGADRAPDPVAVRQTLERSEGSSPPGATTPAPVPSPRAAATPTVAAARPAAPTTPAPAASPQAPADRAAIPAEPPGVAVEPGVVGNGEAMLVTVEAPGAAFATLRHRGESVPLVLESGRFWGVAAVPVSAEPGPALLSVETRTASGRLIHLVERRYEIVLRDRPVDYLRLPEEVMDALLSAEAIEEEARLRARQFSTYDPSPRWEGSFRLPAAGVVTTEFGAARSINDGPVGSPHTGTDIANSRGTPVIASAPGRVSWVGEMPIRGRSVIIDHGGGVMSGYHHLDSDEVAVGQAVEGGQVIGTIGSTGLSTGPHLHWEISVWGVNVDPRLWTKRPHRP